MDIKYMELKEASLTYDLFVPFHRHQEVKKCWRKEDNNWILKEIAFIEEWGKCFLFDYYYCNNKHCVPIHN